MWITFVNGRTVVRIASANILTRSKDICHFKDGTLFLRKGLPGCLTNSFFNLSFGEIHRSWFSCGRGISANFQSWQLLLRLLWPGIFLLKKYLRSYSPVPWLGIPTKSPLNLTVTQLRSVHIRIWRTNVLFMIEHSNYHYTIILKLKSECIVIILLYRN